MNYQGSTETEIPQLGVTLASISEQARDLPDVILESCSPDIRDGNSECFIEWLYASKDARTEFTKLV